MFPFYIFTIFICEHAIISSPSHFRFTSMIQMCHMFKLYLTDLTGTSHSQLQPYYGDRDQPELVGTPGWSVPEMAKARSCSRGNPEFSNFFKLFWNLMKFTEISLVPWHSLTSIFLAFYLFISIHFRENPLKTENAMKVTTKAQWKQKTLHLLSWHFWPRHFEPVFPPTVWGVCRPHFEPCRALVNGWSGRAAFGWHSWHHWRRWYRGHFVGAWHFHGVAGAVETPNHESNPRTNTTIQTSIEKVCFTQKGM